eukprot:1390876-Rhodomonas_salina.1
MVRCARAIQSAGARYCSSLVAYTSGSVMHTLGRQSQYSSLLAAYTRASVMVLFIASSIHEGVSHSTLHR